MRTPWSGHGVSIVVLLLGANALSAAAPVVPPQWVSPRHDGNTVIYRAEALADVGVLANFGNRLEAWSPIGDSIWHADACVQCGDYWVDAALAPDGGAWAFGTYRPDPFAPVVAASIQRIAPDGTLLFSIPAEGVAWSNPSARIFAVPDRAIVLTVARQRLIWQAVAEDGAPLGQREHPMPDDFFDILSARAQPDGSLTLVARGEIQCGVGCWPFNLSLLRLAPDGALAWRYDFANAYWAVASTPDGGMMAVSPRDADGASLLLHRIDAQGNADVPTRLLGVTPSAIPQSLSGPASGRWLLRTWDASQDEDAVWSLDDTGSVGTSRLDLYDSPHAVGEDGFLFPATTGTAPRMQLLDAATLEPRAEFPFGGSGDPAFDYGPWSWRLLPDGSVYGTWTSPGRRLGIARYTLPWGTPQDRLFRNGFD